MHFSLTKLLHGLLYAAPVLLFTLASCGGGASSSTPIVPMVSAYTLGGAASGVLGTGLVLRNNGGDDLTVASGVPAYAFNTSVLAGNSYNVTVLSHPSAPTQKCSVTAASGVMPANNVTNADVSCITAYTISASITNATGAGLVLQNNGGDNLLIPAAASGTTQTVPFSTPLLGNDNYTVSVLTQPHTPSQNCTIAAPSGRVSGGPVTVSVSCGSVVTPPPPDPYVYAANFGSPGPNGVTAYTSAGGVLATPGATVTTGSGPSSVAIDSASKFAYVTNYNANTISAYTIAGGGLTPLDIDPITPGVQNTIATGMLPFSIAVHPSGKFAYVANYSSNSVSAYSIDASGVLASIDADKITAGNQASIPTKVGPFSIAIHPGGGYAYVVNAVTSNISVYSIDATTGALTLIDADGSLGGFQDSIVTGTTPYSITIDPAGLYAYVANSGSNDISAYTINSNGSLSALGAPVGAGQAPHAVAVHPGGGYAYVVNTNDATVGVYSISSTGALTFSSLVATGGTSPPQPVSISIDSTGQYAYVANSGDNSISAYAITGAGAMLTAVSGSPFSAGTSPYAVITSR